MLYWGISSSNYSEENVSKSVENLEEMSHDQYVKD